MASSHRSSPVPQGSSSDGFFKKEVDPAKHIRPVQSLPDVCPQEPTGNVFLRIFLMICVIIKSVVIFHILNLKGVNFIMLKNPNYRGDWEIRI